MDDESRSEEGRSGEPHSDPGADDTRSEQACPVCGEHTLALDSPPHIDVMGVQPYSDLLGMGDLQMAGSLGIICLTCGTHWASREAFERGEPDPESAEWPGTPDPTADDASDSGASGRDAV